MSMQFVRHERNFPCSLPGRFLRHTFPISRFMRIYMYTNIHMLVLLWKEIASSIQMERKSFKYSI